MTCKWWEKTVEYRFVLTAAEHGRMFAAPLDGEEEKAGDAIFSLAKKWLLIEFKRDASCLRTERAKFDDYETACTAMMARDAHHFLVYGSPAERGSNQAFGLTYDTFFSKQSRADFAEVMASGTDPVSFARYINDLVAFKRSGKGGKGSVIDALRHLMIAGVTSDNHLVACVSAEEFILSINRTPEQVRHPPPPKRTRGPEISGPGR